MPHDTFCFDESKCPKFETTLETKLFDKKLLGLAIEKQGENMIALCPKCYTCWSDDVNPTLKCKGVSLKQNRGINKECYEDVLKLGIKLDGQNLNLCLKNLDPQTKNNEMCRITINKTALSGVHTKGRVCENGCVMPLIKDVNYA